MIRAFRIAYNISHLSFCPTTIPYLQKFSQNNGKQDLKILNFDHPAQTPSLITRAFRRKPHAELLELYLEFVCRAEPAPKDIAYASIEETLRNTVLSRLKQANTKVSIERFKVLESIDVEKNEFRGVFIHRKLNLTNANYDITVHKNGSVSFQLKKTQRSDALKEYEKMMRTYSSEKMQEIYCRSMQQFQREREITRQIYKIVADLVLCYQHQGKKVRVGDQGPTEHLLQVESVFNTSYNMHEHFLTDVDFLMKGNYFLRERI